MTQPGKRWEHPFIRRTATNGTIAPAVSCLDFYLIYFGKKTQGGYPAYCAVYTGEEGVNVNLIMLVEGVGYDFWG